MLKEASSALLNKHPLTLDSNQARNRNILKFQNLRNKGLFRGGLSNTQADKKAFYGLLMRATGQKSYMPEGGVTRLGAAGRKDSPHNIKYRQQQLMELKRKIAGTQQEAPIGRPVRNATGPHGIGMGPGGGRADGSGLL